jgi:4-alpha-glucanotransferase
MGAPPSRTNPDGQAWGYPVLDPRQLDEGGAVRAFLRERIDELLEHHDGVRVDHGHGWVCPWVYRSGGDVRDGARLFESPDLPDHPALGDVARVRPEQLDRALPRHHDEWVRWLEPAQVDAYARAFDLLVARADALGLARVDILAEVLSTCPRPLAAVLERYGLGRFRVTQKAILDDPGDPYRADRAPPRDWVMVGNHDTPPLARVVLRWQGTAELARRAAYLGARLGVDPLRLERDPRALADAMLADCFLGPARHVLVYWVDLFEGRELFNRPGVVSAENWRLRVPPDFETAYGGALGRAAALALASRQTLQP